MEENAQVIYICSACHAPLEQATFETHACLVNATEDGTDNEVEGESIQFYLQEPEPDVEEFLLEKLPETRKRAPTKGRRGDWSDEDVFRLIELYIKHYKEMPPHDGLPSHYFWNRVMRDLKPYGDFSRFLVQAKVKKLKSSCQAILQSGNESKWPYFHQMCELLRVENEVIAMVSAPSKGQTDDEAAEQTETEEPTTSDGVKGLRRWTIKESKHLIAVYKKHLPQFFNNYNRKRIAWHDIIADLAYDLPKRFTMYQIRAKLRNIQNMYRDFCISASTKKRKKVLRWPLFQDMVELADEERRLATLHGHAVNIYAVEPPNELLFETVTNQTRSTDICDIVRWNAEETEELLNAYHLYKVRFKIQSPDLVWRQIADCVNQIRRRKINGQQAKLKFESLRSAYHTKDEKMLTPLSEKVTAVLEEEPDETGGKKAKQLSPPVKAESLSSDEEMVRPKRVKRNLIPEWYREYSRDAERRHNEKILVQKQIISALENILMPS